MNSFAISIVIGFFIGCVFGVGCALAVMYSIYIGGYRRPESKGTVKEHIAIGSYCIDRLLNDREHLQREQCGEALEQLR